LHVDESKTAENANANALAATSVQRNVVDRVNSGRRTENEAFAADIMDHRLLFGPVDLASQPTHVDIDEIALRYELVIPT